MRWRQYEAVVRLVRALPDRWPRLLKLVRQHHSILLTWSTLLPAILALVLCLANTFACRLIWPHAHLTLDGLLESWIFIALAGVFGLFMLGVDVYATFRVGKIDREMIEKYFDQAEYWLRSWAAPVVKFFTLGKINPRKMVTVEVRKALVEASKLINSSLWWVTVQVSFRIAFGITLWIAWAFRD